MTLVQIRDVSEETVNVLRARAAEEGLSLTAYLRAQLDRLAARPTNAEIMDRLARRDRTGNPTVAETVAEIRRLRNSS
ncbi:MAG: FitA-like ribbon-helix-helix domain-containing protein [Micromonosporaceae bacterium]